jgi:endonuclease/exonuclease/phosphatase family metal-dependent hydrolase
MSEKFPEDSFTAALREIEAELLRHSSIQLPKVEAELPPPVDAVPKPTANPASSNIGLGIISPPSPSPEPMPSFRPEIQRSDTPKTAEWWQENRFRSVAAVAALAILVVIGAEKFSGNDDRTGADGKHHGKLHHRKSHHPARKSDISTANDATKSHPKNLTPDVITSPSPVAPSTPETPTPTHTPGSTGTGVTTLKLATYNVRGSKHTPARGPRSGPNRADTQAKLIKEHGFAVTGLQELERNQRRSLMHNLGDNYGIYPKNPHYGVHNPGVNSVNSVIWDKRQVQFKKGKSLPMPLYFNDWHYNIPLVKFKAVGTHQTFEVANTHDPAHKQWAKNRWLDAKEHAEDAKEIIARHMSFFLLGDFNSGYSQGEGGNITYHGKRRNLSVHIMEEQGNMVDSLNALKGKQGRSLRAKYKSGSGIVDHGFVSPDIGVTNYHVTRHGTASDHSVVSFTAKLPQNHQHKHHHKNKP